MFGGIFSDHNAISNYGNFPVQHDGHLFPTLEHGFVFHKCMEAANDLSANDVFGVPEPHQAKRIGGNLKNLHNTAWGRIKDDVMMNLLKSKFVSNSEPARALLGILR